MDISKMKAVGLSAAIKNKEISVTDVVRFFLDMTEKKDKETEAFITVDAEGAMRRAEQVQSLIDKGELSGPLAGVPIAVKDNICTRGLRTTAASKILENFVPVYNATVCDALEDNGLVIIGKTNMDEFAMGSTSETSYYKTTRNPADLTRVPGGSSGGSAAAVAAGEVPLSLGSDTGGSIRQPAAYCGVTGIKPTYGTVSRYGLIAYGSSLDQIGPMAGNVEDAVHLLDIISSHDPKDSTSVKKDRGVYADHLSNDVNGLRVGIPSDYMGDGLEKEIKQAVLKAADSLKDKGAMVEEFELGMLEYVVPAYYVIASAEAGSNLSRFDGVKYGFRAKSFEDMHDMYRKTRSEGFGKEVQRRIMLGNFVLSSGFYDAYYLKALKVRNLIRQSYDKAFEKYDVILGPVAPQTAPELGSSLLDPIRMYLSDIYTVSANLTGIPGISIPCGVSSEGLPIGIQFMADRFREDLMIRAAYAFQEGENG